MRRPLREIARGATWLVGIALALRVVDVFLGHSPLGATLAGAVLVDLATHRAGVRWDEGEETGRMKRALVGVGRGLAVALALVVLTVLVCAAVGSVQLRAGSPSLALVLGMLRAGASGVRDELLYRGLPLLVGARVGLGARASIGYAALAGASALLLVPGASVESLVLATALGVLFAVIWQRSGEAWGAVAAHAGWVFFAGAALRGGLVEATWVSGALGEGARARGLAALVAAVVSLGAAAAVWRWWPKGSPAGPSRRSTP
ncbi:type II CAAX prenyl endopeptidase Rce1 family protein [Polyangium aurulentum]|uniref:CPBP family glutamic-type intramembrane protease n=1 Tax=Polyangium aurulentum TaxID=2567896 RepID=UPI0010AE594F|nr:CPBP family glutamic-type intramembrane protease [Polyangium aurulentum]UQA62219.1 hypothetical protein E8A73_017815 [Polyangium aurulentum]